MLKPNTLLQNRYLVVRLLAKGGMGAVYEARDQRLNNTVALKETFFTDEKMRRAFHREAALLATLRHPALPKVIDHFTEGEGQFLVMEFIAGDDLARLAKISGGPIPERDVMAWADQLLGVLEYLHSQRQSIIHRDIKPQNLKLNERGEIILLDFGLAKEDTLGTGAVNQSVPLSVRGYTLIYAPLEQIQGTGTDPRSDLYSAAATIYHLMTGVAPADAVTRATAFIEGRPDPLRPAHEINPRISPAIAGVLRAALSQDRNGRPASAAIMREQLRQAVAAGNVATERQQAGVTTVPMAPPPIFHSQPKQAIPLNVRAESPPAETQPTAGYAVPQTAPMTTSPGSQPATPYLPFNVPATPYPPFNVVEAKPNSRMKLLLGAGVVIIAVVLVLSILFALRIWPKKNNLNSTGRPATKTGTDALNLADATLLSSRELILEGGPENRLYTFTAEPGELKLTLNVIGKGSTVTVEAFDQQKKELRFKGDRSDLVVSSTGSNEQAEARLFIGRETRILLAVKTAYPESLEALRLRIEGPAKISETHTTSPLSSLFSDRDHPKSLSYDTVYGGQGTPTEVYYAFTAGPGEVKFTLDVIGKGSGAELELFNAKSRKINFASGASNFTVSSTGQHEQGLAKLQLGSREQLLMRVRTNYPDSLQAYRLKLEGQIESVTAGAADPAGQALAPLFASRDNPLPLNSKELSSTSLDKDYYYLLRAGPGTVTFDVDVAADGSIFTVELFNSEAKQIKFNNGSEKFSISSTGNRQSGKAEITLRNEERLVMRISNTYPTAMKKYRLKIDGAIKKAFGE